MTSTNTISAHSGSKKIISLVLVAALFLLWMAPGLVGRDLWKADEPYSFGLIYHIVKTGDWVVPTLAGEPFMEKPPIFYLTAAGFARLFSPWLPIHEAARLACVFFMLLTAVFMGLAAKELLGKGSISITIVVLIGSAGLQEVAHKLITDLAMIAGISIAMYGLAVCGRRYVLGGVLIGTGAGLGFMSKGLLAPGFIGLTALAMPAIFVEWRRKTYFHSLLISFAAALPWLTLWPLALYLRSPDLFIEWFWYQNLGRFLGYAHVGRKFSWTFYFVNLPWFALPALPIASWVIWRERRALRTYSGVSLPLILFLVMLAVLTLSSSIRDIYALPMLLPLSLLAAAGAGSFPGRAKNVINRLDVYLFGTVACLLWIGWIIMISGVPATLAHKLYRMQPDFMPAFSGLSFAVACLYTFLWLLFVFRSARFEHSYLLNWTAGTVLALGLLMSIWLPWFEAGSGYRPLFMSLKSKIPDRCGFVMAKGLGESERALLEYYTGVIPRTVAGNGAWDCDILLMQSGEERLAPPPGTDWQVIWERWRPSTTDRPKEIFTLLQRKGGKQICR